MVLIKKIRANLSKILNRIAESDDLEKIKENEGKLMMAMLGPMLLLAAVVSMFVGSYWQESWDQVLTVSGVLLFCGVFILLLLHLKLPHRLALHVMSITLLFGLLATYLAYYQRFTVIFWMIIVIMMIMSNMMIDRTLFYYMLLAGILFFVDSVVTYPVLTIRMDYAFNLTLVAVFLCIVLASIVTNRIYQQIIEKKSLMYANTASQKESLNNLYDEVLAHQQQLEAQNELLLHYNAEIEDNQKRLEFLAYTDTLTGIPNRKKFLEQVELLIELNQENPHRFAIVFIDLDNFKKINDSMGHDAGDDLLIQVTARLKNAIHEKDLLGRLGGDELAMLIRRQITDEALLGYTENLLKLLANPLKLGDKSVMITASFGIAIWPIDAKSSSDLLKAADTAMYKAKELGKNSIQFYQKEMKTEVLYKMALENQMLEAFENEAFFLEYQPIVCATDKKTVSFEALLRWRAPDRGLISPAEFIPLAEEIGLIGELGEWVLRQACKKIIEIRKRLQVAIHIAVNVSAVQMKRPVFLEGVKTVIREEGVAPECLTFEITETVFIDNMEQSVAIIKDLKALGVTVSLDDFGTGYSSLSYLMQLPIDILKIDRSFIKSLENDQKNSQIVGSIIEMVHSLNIVVVAEGVEEIPQYEFLKNKQCDLIQGYLFSRPLGDEAMIRHLIGQQDLK